MRQRTPRVNGRHRVNGRLASMDASPVLVTNNMDYCTRSLGEGQR